MKGTCFVTRKISDPIIFFLKTIRSTGLIGDVNGIFVLHLSEIQVNEKYSQPDEEICRWNIDDSF